MRWMRLRYWGEITRATFKFLGSLNGSTGFDAVVFTEHILRPFDEIPEVVECLVDVGHGSPLGMRGESAGSC